MMKGYLLFPVLLVDFDVYDTYGCNAACTSVSETCVDASSLQVGSTSSYHTVSNGHHQSPKGYSDGTSLMSSIHANEQTTDGNLWNQRPLSNGSKDTVFPNSIPEATVSEEFEEPVLIPQPIDYLARRKCFPPYWSTDAICKGPEKGELLTAVFRVNAHNRLEAYCKIDGVQTDILISGVVAQNRAIDGDTVAIVIDSPSLWPRMKGSNETISNVASHNNFRDVNNVRDCSRGKCKLDVESEYNDMVLAKDEAYCDYESPSGAMSDNVSGCQITISDSSYGSRISLDMLCSLISLFPSKRPTGTVVAVIERPVRQDRIVGFLSVKQWICSRENKKKYSKKDKHQSDLNHGYVLLTPTDPKFTKMMVPLRNLPASIRKRLEAGDLTIKSDLVAAEVVDWAEECYTPMANVVHVFGRGSDIEAQIAAILFENAIDASDFSSDVLSCLPHTRWEIPPEELQTRRDLRNLCIFTIDPSTAAGLDDALSVETLSNGNYRVGVHIADVSYFVLPDTALDDDAQIRSTSVYLLLRKLPMLPPMLSDNLASLNPGEDRLAFSIFWDMNSAGEVLDRWIARTIIRSCCKLSYKQAQEIINGLYDFQDSNLMVNHWPNLFGQFLWYDVIESVKKLDNISKLVRKNRLESTMVSTRKDSNFLVEEFMLLANRTAAEVILRAYPLCSLLRRRPEPNARKLRDFEAFCGKHGLKLDVSSSAHLHNSLEHIRGKLESDSVLFDILMSYAARPMQVPTYFCSGELEDVSDHGHYALAVPLYTHFTSPLRRYPDIVVHRTLAAALEAEDTYLERKRTSRKVTEEETLNRCFTGLYCDKDEIYSVEAQESLSIAASKHGVLGTESLADVAAYCNAKRLAARHVKDATDKLYMLVLLKKKKILYSAARVLGLGPKFMSIYITKLAIERRIYYDKVEGLTVEWLDSTSTLLLSHSASKRSSKKGSLGKCRTIDEVALIVSPSNLNLEASRNFMGENRESQSSGGSLDVVNFEPVFFPLTVHLLSTIPVALHAIGGDDGPLDIVARLYIGSYFH